MRRDFSIVGAILLIAATLSVGILPQVEAAGFNGRRSYSATLLPNETAVFEIPFRATEQAELLAYSLGKADVEMIIYDGDGNVWFGVGPWGRKSTRIKVYRSGFFHVQIRNLGPDASNFGVRVN